MTACPPTRHPQPSSLPARRDSAGQERVPRGYLLGPGCGSTSPKEASSSLILTPSSPSPVIVDQQSQAPIVPRGFPEEGVNQNDDLWAKEGDVFCLAVSCIPVE